MSSERAAGTGAAYTPAEAPGTTHICCRAGVGAGRGHTHATHAAGLLTATFSLLDQLSNLRAAGRGGAARWPPATTLTSRFTNITPTRRSDPNNHFWRGGT